MLLSASVKRFNVSRMRDFFLFFSRASIYLRDASIPPNKTTFSVASISLEGILLVLPILSLTRILWVLPVLPLAVILWVLPVFPLAVILWVLPVFALTRILLVMPVYPWHEYFECCQYPHVRNTLHVSSIPPNWNTFILEGISPNRNMLSVASIFFKDHKCK